MDHLTPMELATLLDGRGTSDWTRAVAAHMDECYGCFELWLLVLQTQGREQQMKIVTFPLLPLVDGMEDRAVADGPRVEIPSLTTSDHRIVVQFSQPLPEGPIRAALVGSLEDLPGTIYLTIPGAGKEFAFDSRGRTVLAGVTAQQLRGARLELTLEQIERLREAPSSET